MIPVAIITTKDKAIAKVMMVANKWNLESLSSELNLVITPNLFLLDFL
jgi:hypothetical protein